MNNFYHSSEYISQKPSLKATKIFRLPNSIGASFPITIINEYRFDPETSGVIYLFEKFYVLSSSFSNEVSTLK